VDGHAIQPMEGTSLRPFFDTDRETPRTLCWEHMQNRGIRDGSWKLVAARGGPWELYDINADPTELNNLVTGRPDTAEGLAAKWTQWAKRVGVQDFDRLGKLEVSSP
jgi:arylsulfatase